MLDDSWTLESGEKKGMSNPLPLTSLSRLFTLTKPQFLNLQNKENNA